MFDKIFDIPMQWKVLKKEDFEDKANNKMADTILYLFHI